VSSELAAAPSAKCKLSVIVGDKRTDKQTDIAIV